LERTLESIEAAGIDREKDEIFVVGDGPCASGERIAVLFRERGLKLFYLETRKTGCAGHFQRNTGMRVATGTHFLSFDDDDVYRVGALSVMRKAIESNPDRVHIFRMAAKAKRLPYDVLWSVPKLGEGNVGTPMFAVPNDRARLGTWTERYAGDFDFISETVQKSPGGEAGIVWREEIIADIY
jgi:hypothetical protein